MNNLFYPKLAYDNLRKNGKIYFPYIISCIFTVAMLYSVCSLSFNSGIAAMPGGAVVASLMFMGVGIVAIFAGIFLFYTNSFLMKRRHKEFGLFNILGMEKKHITVMIFFENFYIWFLGLNLGLALGLLLDKLIYMVLYRLVDFEAPLGFYISSRGILITACLFTAVFFLLFIKAIREIKVQNAVELLHSENFGEREPKAKVLQAIIGFVCLLAGYAVSFFVTNPLKVIELFFVAVLLVVIGTYLILSAGSVTMLKALKKNKRFYYKPRHFISVSGLMYRMKQNAVGLGNICILSTMVLVMLSTTICLWSGLDSELDKRFSNDIIISVSSADNLIDSSVRKTAAKAFSANNAEPTEKIQFRYLSFAVLTGENGEYLIEKPVNSAFTPDLTYIHLVTEEQFNKNSDYKVELKPDEVMLYSDRETDNFSDISLGNIKLHVKGRLNYWIGLDELSSVSIAKSIYLVVSDDDVLNGFYDLQSEVYGQNCSEIKTVYGYSTNADKETQKNLSNYIAEHLSDYNWNNDYSVRSKASAFSETKAMYGGFLFIGVFLSTLFVMAAVLIIYYKQVSEGYDDMQRYEIMQKVGMDKHEVKRTIGSQIITVFFLPLVFAGLHMIAALPALSRLLGLFNISNFNLFYICTACCFIIFSLLYFAVYTLTAKAYYKIVSLN